MLKPLISFDWAVKRLLRNKANFGTEGVSIEIIAQSTGLSPEEVERLGVAGR